MPAKDPKAKMSLPEIDPSSFFTAPLAFWGAHMPPQWIMDPATLRDKFDPRVLQEIYANRLDTIAQIADISAKAMRKEADLVRGPAARQSA